MGPQVTKDRGGVGSTAAAAELKMTKASQLAEVDETLQEYLRFPSGLVSAKVCEEGLAVVLVVHCTGGRWKKDVGDIVESVVRI